MKSPSPKFLRMAPLYKHFAEDYASISDFSDLALEDMYFHESEGTKLAIKNNGFLIGKKLLNLQVSDWKVDIENGLLFKIELYNDPNYPHWWLDSIGIKDIYIPPDNLAYRVDMWTRKWK